MSTKTDIKIVCIGAGSAVFGLNALATLMRSKHLHGSHIAMVDRNLKALSAVSALADRLNKEWGAGMTISRYGNHKDALSGADFVILAIEVSPREKLWQMDYEIPLKHGVRQPYAENGGPGGFAHAARNIGPVMEIASDMESLCPQAILINYTNPMQRICDAVARHSSIQVVGLCHQIGVGYAMVGKVLSDLLDIEVPVEFTNTHASPSVNPFRDRVARKAEEAVSIIAAGVNHFTWMLALHERATGRDLYPVFRDRWQNYSPEFEPLTRRVFNAFGLFPIPGDEHLCEYLPWVSDPGTEPWKKYDLSLYEWDLRADLRVKGHEEISRLASGQGSVEHLKQVHSEGAVEVVEAIACGVDRFWPAVNIPNRGLISNLPEDAIVEVPAWLSPAGISGIQVGDMPEAIAELLRREITTSRLCVDACIANSHTKALQCLLLDPVIRDMDVAVEILEDYRKAYGELFPQFR